MPKVVHALTEGGIKEEHRGPERFGKDCDLAYRKREEPRGVVRGRWTCGQRMGGCGASSHHSVRAYVPINVGATEAFRKVNLFVHVALTKAGKERVNWDSPREA